MAELEIHVHKPHVIVNMRGTRLTITYELSSDGRSLVESPFWTGDDRNAPILLNEFRSSAWMAAQKKAHEIGWISADNEPHSEAAASAKLFSLVTRTGGGRAVQASSSFENRRTESKENAQASVLPGEAMIECAARALFEYVFARSERLDAKHLWLNCDEATKEGFRAEARAALQAAWALWLQDVALAQMTQRPIRFARS